MNVIKEILSWITWITGSIVVALCISIFILRPSQVLGESMEPTLHDRDIKLVFRLPQALGFVPDYNDIVIIDSRVDHIHTIKDDLKDIVNYNVFSTVILKKENRNYWVKRVIGKSGDVLEFKDGKVYRNGTALNEPYIKEKMEYLSDEKIVVPEDHIYVMGDNRNHSSDSRVIGPVPIQNVLGKVMFEK